MKHPKQILEKVQLYPNYKNICTPICCFFIGTMELKARKTNDILFLLENNKCMGKTDHFLKTEFNAGKNHLL